MYIHGFSAARDEPSSGTRKPQSLTARLQSYGFAGVASYGLLNTAYYITAFMFFWTRVAKVPKGDTRGMPTSKGLSCNMPFLQHTQVSLSKHGDITLSGGYTTEYDAFMFPKWCAISGLGLAEAAKQFVGVMSLTWAGSQVTKVAVAACIWLVKWSGHRLLALLATLNCRCILSLSVRAGRTFQYYHTSLTSAIPFAAGSKNSCSSSTGPTVGCGVLLRPAAARFEISAYCSEPACGTVPWSSSSLFWWDSAALGLSHLWQTSSCKGPRL